MSLPPVPTSFNLTAHVLDAALRAPNKTALEVLSGPDVGQLTYDDLRQAVLGTATGFVNMGLTAGDRILFRLGNTPDFPIAYLAAIAVDLIPVPTSAQLTRAEVTRIAADLTPAAIIAGSDIALPDHPARVVLSDELRRWRGLPPADIVMGDPNRPGYIIYTSGTSGTSRGVVHAHRAIWARQSMIQGWYGLTSDDRMLHAGAFNWTYTLGTGLMDPWTIGATALIPGPDHGPADLPGLLRNHDATLFAAAPGVYRQALRSPIPPLPDLRHGLSAGEKLPETTRAAWLDATGTPIFEAYGMSECSTFISSSPTSRSEVGTLGRPQPGRRVALMNAAGALADEGQIVIHKDDPGLMLGYLNAPVETAARFSGDWFQTGDLGTRLPSGTIRYDGRADDMMNAGGYRVSPLEVEAALALHPAIEEAAAIEAPVKADASVIAAFYVSDDVLNEGELSAHCARHLARYKTPRLFIRIDSLPRGANNKLLRRSLRDTWKARHGQT
ncbi:MAG: class I adenylate-forming enzyme family protein [Pseudomonadota bacterium]